MAEVDADCDEIVAHLPGVIAAVAKTAEKGGVRAAILLTQHTTEGDQGHARITVTHGSVDSFVNLDDTRSQSAAAAIEFGRSGGKRGPSEGIFVLTRAF